MLSPDLELAKQPMERAVSCPDPANVRQRISLVTSPLRAAFRIRRKYNVLKQKRLLLEKSEHTAPQSLGLSRFHSREPLDVFTFDGAPKGTLRKRRLKRGKCKVLYPNGSKRYLPEEKQSKAKNCLFLLSIIVCFQIYNAIENLDDNVLKYDLEGLEKTLRREVFGQTAAIEHLMDLLEDYLATHNHNKPLVLSLNGPSGVGKSHVGRLLAKHFRSVMNEKHVLQYFVLHQCPEEVETRSCEQELAKSVSNLVNRAEEEEKIPVFIFDEMEHMRPALLDFLGTYFRTNQTNEFLNAVYVLISSVGQAEVTKFVLQNASSDALYHANTAQELLLLMRWALTEHHPLWKHADIVPFTLLEKSHIVNCFLEEMMREGFYPDTGYLEELARELNYYSVAGRQYSVHGCKQVVSMVNLLH
ncbi:torsin-4A-A-like [Callorhinchus milii]|uniref:Torsin family 4, member Ab n=1 Tax=Callorhinchus milii TaxID=7868 RepID=A0A4W3GWX7_CALMI|nr:torsin-4A-A-like [Callorhinchus milii]|eukprot:gi/632988813/ref/XP_007883315.1/ PREDICTED: torsin-4A [Callorhinchus milii]